MEKNSQENKSISGTSEGARTGISPDKVAANRNLPNGAEQGNTVGSPTGHPEAYHQELKKNERGVQPDYDTDK